MIIISYYKLIIIIGITYLKSTRKLYDDNEKDKIAVFVLLLLLVVLLFYGFPGESETFKNSSYNNLIYL